jgi:hypothetical protein
MSSSTRAKTELKAVRRNSVKDMMAKFKGNSVADSPASVQERVQTTKERESAVAQDLEKLLHNPKAVGMTLQDE